MKPMAWLRGADSMISFIYLWMALTWSGLSLYDLFSRSGRPDLEIIVSLLFFIAYEAREIRMVLKKKGGA